MSGFDQRSEYYLRQTPVHGEVFFPPTLPFLRGYVIRSPRIRDMIVRRMKWLDDLGIAMLVVSLLGGLLLGHLGASLSLWLTLSSATYWYGTRSLKQRTAALPLRESLDLWTRDLKLGDLYCGVHVSVVFGGGAIGYGLTCDDPAMVVLGTGLLIWAFRLAGLLFIQLIRRTAGSWRGCQPPTNRSPETTLFITILSFAIDASREAAMF